VNRLRALPFAARIYLVALALRLIPVLLAIDLPIGLDDMFQYDMLGRSLAAGNGFRWYAQEDLDLARQYVDFDFVVGDYDPRGILTSFRAPLYPAFLTGVYLLSGLTWRLFAARLAQAFIGATLAPLAYALGKRLFPEAERGAQWAGWAMAVYPMLLIYPLALATENLFIPLVAAATLALLHAADSGRGRDYALAGALLGLATLTRSVILGFVGLAILWVWFSRRERRGALLLAAAVFVLVTPWVVRNSLLHGKLSGVESSMGYNLYLSYHPEGSGSFQYGISLDLLPYLDDAQREAIGMQSAIGFIRDDPGRVAPLALQRLGYFFGLEKRAISYFYSNGFFGAIPQAPLIGLFLLFTVPFVVLATLSVAALALMQSNANRWLVLLLIGGYLLPHVLILAEPRFHLTLVPLLAAFAGYTLADWPRLRQRAQTNRWRLVLALVLVALLWSNWGMELWRDADKLAALFGPEGWQAGFSY